MFDEPNTSCRFGVMRLGQLLKPELQNILLLIKVV
jgi:hypothetical protein